MKLAQVLLAASTALSLVVAGPAVARGNDSWYPDDWEEGDDIEPEQLPAGFDWTRYAEVTIYGVRENKRVPGTLYGYPATGGGKRLLWAHNRCDDIPPGEPVPLGHVHFSADYGGMGMPTVAEGNEYHDAYFGKYCVQDWQEKFTREGSCTTVRNCHAWALAQKINSGGCMDYWFTYADDLEGAYEADLTKRGSKFDVQKDDLLLYGQEHSTFVVDVQKFATNPDRYRPKELRWKNGCSGVYTYKNTGATDRFATPDAYICGGYNLNIDWDEQEWVWLPNRYYQLPGCWTEN